MIAANELRNMTQSEIVQKLEALKKDLYNLRIEAKERRLDKPHKITETRRAIARCETILKEKANVK